MEHADFSLYAERRAKAFQKMSEASELESELDDIAAGRVESGQQGSEDVFDADYMKALSAELLEYARQRNALKRAGKLPDGGISSDSTESEPEMGEHYARETIDAKFETLRAELRSDFVRIEGSFNHGFERLSGDIRAFIAADTQRQVARDREVAALTKALEDSRQDLNAFKTELKEDRKHQTGMIIGVVSLIVAVITLLAPMLQDKAPSAAPGAAQTKPAP